MFSFEDQIVVVTGASRGIGRGIAQHFARVGGRVACVATTESNAAGTADTINAEGGFAQAFGCDIGSTESVEALCAGISESMGTPSVIVNNAGVTADMLIPMMSDEQWDRVIDVNLKGAFRMIRAGTKLMMKARYGRIVNISSVIGLHGGAGQANYAAAKAGLIGLTLTTAKEFGKRGITCNAIAPGFIETDMTHDLKNEFREYVQKTAPAQRLGTPDDIAPAVLFLASKEAAYVTGQVLTVDGGLML